MLLKTGNMAFSGKKVARMLRIKGIKAKDYFAYVYPERSGNASFSDIEKNDNPKAETVERIADLLQCPIDDLFDRETQYVANQVTGDNNTVSSYNVTADPEVLAATNRHLRDVIDRQDKTIEELNRRIDQLIDLAKR